MSRSVDIATTDTASTATWPPWELYGAWEAARDDAREALAAWRSSPPVHRRTAFLVYRAAADREDAAAVAWMRA
jgi:hypothetical protein